MDNYLLMKKSKDLEDFSRKLGFEKTLFLGEDFIFITGGTKKELMKQANGKKLTIYEPDSEEMLRFALEKTKVDILIGAEKINLRDSVHFVRGGLDQSSVKIAVTKGKKIGFSFLDILNSKNQGKLLARMALNLKLCQKYKAEVVFSTFAKNRTDLRAQEDLVALLTTLK